MLDRAPPAPGRTYHQHCPVARSLDVIGERWTLLLVRDLIVGPKRYKDLLSGAPGIGTNLLAARLRELEDLGLVQRRVLPPPAGSTVYELTDAGRALEPIIMDLGRWAMRFLGPPRPSDVILPSAYFVGLRARFQPRAATGLSETYELWIDGHVFQIHIDAGECITSEGLEPNIPDVVVTTDMPTFHDLLAEHITPASAISSGRVMVKGDPAALERLVRLFAQKPPSETVV